VPDQHQRDAAALEIEQGVTTLYRSSKARVRELVTHFHPDLQASGYMVLRYVMDNEPIRAGDVAAALSMDKSAISRQLAVLRDSGLVVVLPDPEDGRAGLLVSSDDAKAKLEVFRSGLKADYQRVLADWSADDVADFARLLTRFNALRH
jgi:DNA-binding MarR family transcriptional regulator